MHETTPGTLVVGISRLGPLGGSSGSGTLMTLEFDSAASGSGSLSFTNNTAFAADGTALGAIQWLGGTVQVVR